MRAKFGPRFFFMLTESLVEAFRTRLEQLGFDLADLRIGGTPNRPLVQVRIDCPPRNVTVEDCTRVSRALEEWLDSSGGPLGSGNRYVLEVSSPGIERPIRWPRHWTRFVGRDVNVKIAGLGRLRARIVAVPDDETVVLQPQGGAEREFRLSDVKDARLASETDG
ncbi:MAG TPA: ribosome maturation factor RimP [Gemmatimonadales bacterium]|nr:ribosome maturation factor RimP [Gemmatimonadales bacterium]